MNRLVRANLILAVLVGVAATLTGFLYYRATEKQRLASDFQTMADYENIMGKTKTMAFMGGREVVLDGYVSRKSADGLFLMLGQQEKMIRGNPAARSTDLLKKVFGK